MINNDFKNSLYFYLYNKTHTFFIFKNRVELIYLEKLT